MKEASVCSTCGAYFGPEFETCPNDGTPLRRGDRTLAPRDPLIGATVNGYRIEGLLGAGGLGLVYRGVEPAIGKPVAIKVLRWEVASDPAQVQRLMLEAKAVNAVRHRGIVDIFSMGQLPDGRHFLVMELLEGEPLDQIIAARAPLAPLEITSLLDELLDALGAAHRAGVVHRDLKPSNVFVVRPPYGTPYVKLLDFGLAKQTAVSGAALTRASVIVGTPLYMAPEQARGEAVGPATDLYALGVILFELLTGKPPFDAQNVYETIHQHLSAPVPRPSQVHGPGSRAFDELVVRLMSKAPEDRPASAEAVREELKRLIAPLQGGTTAPRPTDLYVTDEQTVRSGSSLRVRRALSRILKRKRGTSVALAVSLGALLLGGTALFALQARPRLSEPGQAPPVAAIAEPLPDAPPVVAQPPPAVVVPAAVEPVPVAPPVPAPAVHQAPVPSPVAVTAPPKKPRPVAKPAAANGTFKIHVFPWADVWIDGELRQRGGMDFEALLPAGQHRLKLANPQLSTHEETITIIGGQTLEKRVRLQRSHAP